MTENNNNELPSEETVAAHLEEHADMFAVTGDTPTASTTPTTIQTQEVSLDEPSNALPDDATQTLSVAELRELLDFAFSQGRLRGFFDGQAELLSNIQQDPEVDQTTKDYFNSIYPPQDINVEGESE